MCDFSLMHAKSRPAKVADKLETKNFGAGTVGFCDPTEPDVAVCVLPGTEIAFEDDIELGYGRGLVNNKKCSHKVAIFRQVDKDTRLAHHDALELPSGDIVKLTALVPGQKASVLQLPAEPKTEQEAQEQKRLEIVA